MGGKESKGEEAERVGRSEPEKERQGRMKG
jgi:hypothetical protein